MLPRAPERAGQCVGRERRPQSSDPGSEGRSARTLAENVLVEQRHDLRPRIGERSLHGTRRRGRRWRRRRGWGWEHVDPHARRHTRNVRAVLGRKRYGQTLAVLPEAPCRPAVPTRTSPAPKPEPRAAPRPAEYRRRWPTGPPDQHGRGLGDHDGAGDRRGRITGVREVRPNRVRPCAEGSAYLDAIVEVRDGDRSQAGWHRGDGRRVRRAIVDKAQ
jgi:hypothetical protein